MTVREAGGLLPVEQAGHTIPEIPVRSGRAAVRAGGVTGQEALFGQVLQQARKKLVEPFRQAYACGDVPGGMEALIREGPQIRQGLEGIAGACLLYTSDAADE